MLIVKTDALVLRLGAKAKSRCRLLMTADADLVSVWISEVCAIVMGVILRSEPWQPRTTATIRQGGGMTAVNGVACRCQESGHMPVARASRLTIEWQPDEEQRPFGGCSAPPRPEPFGLMEPQFEPEHFEQS
jgi:hypothetical protein